MPSDTPNQEQILKISSLEPNQQRNIANWSSTGACGLFSLL